MQSKGTIEVEFSDSKSRDAALKAVSHEGNVGNRSTTKVVADGNALKLEIDAEDIVALRSAMNAFLRALQVFEGVKKEV